MLRAISTRTKVASAVVRECANLSRASVVYSKNKKRPKGKPRQFQDEANPSGSKQVYITVEASVGEVFAIEDQGSPHESAFVTSNTVDTVFTNPGSPKPEYSIEDPVGFGISHQVKTKKI